MRLSLVRACPLLPGSYEFQSTRNLALAGYFTAIIQKAVALKGLMTYLLHFVACLSQT